MCWSRLIGFLKAICPIAHHECDHAGWEKHEDGTCPKCGYEVLGEGW